MKNFYPPPQLSRRQFLRLLALFGSAAGLAACQKAGILATPGQLPTSTLASTLSPSSTFPVTTTAAATSTTAPLSLASLQPAASSGPARSRVSLVSTQDRAEGMRKAIDLLGSNPVAGQDVFLKPNFNSADPTPGSTHPELLRALVLKLQEMGASRITLGDRSGMGDTRQVMQRLGVFDLARELNFEALVLDDLSAADWNMMTPQASHWSQGFPFARPCLDCGAIVQTCCLKTHGYGGHFTLSLKNSVGLVAKRVPGQSYNYMSELHGSPDQRRMIAEINLAYQPALVVLDGVEAFVSGGPDRGELVRPGVVLAGSDRVAIDAIGVAVLRLFGTTPEVSNGPVFQLEQIARAVELGLGASGPDQIELLTADPESQAFAARIMEELNRN